MNRYYQLEARALDGGWSLERGPAAGGTSCWRTSTPKTRAEQEATRFQALLRVSQRALALSAPPPGAGGSKDKAVGRAGRAARRPRSCPHGDRDAVGGGDDPVLAAVGSGGDAAGDAGSDLMSRPGKGLEHVERLDADATSKARLKAILETLSGALSVETACDRLSISPYAVPRAAEEALGAGPCRRRRGGRQPDRPTRSWRFGRRTRNCARNWRCRTCARSLPWRSLT